VSLYTYSTSDIEINCGYRFGGHTSWQYSAEEKTYDAVWNQAEPEIDNRGIYISLGYKMILLK
jgi:hypothetical protein